MQAYEYKVVPAPKKGLKGKGIKGAEARYANALQTVMNEMGAEGWEYQRTDTLPFEERQGLTGRTTTFQTMLVFRRVIAEETAEDTPDAAEATPPLIEDKTETQAAEARRDETLGLTDPVEAPARQEAPDDAQPAPESPRHAAE